MNPERADDQIYYFYAFLAGGPNDDPAALVELSGPGIGPTNSFAIVAGPPTNLVIVARAGSPAPGNAGYFKYFSTDDRSMALAPDGRVAFSATTDTTSGLWFGDASALTPVALAGKPAPASLGSGSIFGFVGTAVEVNSGDQLVFEASLSGPTINGDCVIAGAPGALRVVAESGQPAPGIPGASFQSFSAPGPVLAIGEDGAVAFGAAYAGDLFGFGLWLAPANGATPILLMRTGAPAPGAPSGVYFTNSQDVAAFVQVFMNGRDEIVFRTDLTGPGSDTNLFRNVGIWLAEPDGTVNLVARTGQMMDIGGGRMRELQNVTFGDNPPTLSGPADGRPRLFNNAGQIALWAEWQNPPGPPDFGGYGEGLFIAQAGLILSAERSGNDVVPSFPTLAGKHYRVDYKTDLSAASWSVFVPSVNGTGSQVSITNALPSTARAFFRAARTD